MDATFVQYVLTCDMTNKVAITKLLTVIATLVLTMCL